MNQKKYRKFDQKGVSPRPTPSTPPGEEGEKFAEGSPGAGGWSTFISIGWIYDSHGQQPFKKNKNITGMIPGKTYLRYDIIVSPFHSLQMPFSYMAYFGNYFFVSDKRLYSTPF